MADIDPEILLRARSYLSITHHEPGSIRLRFKPAILSAVPEIATSAGHDVLSGWDAIQDVKLNALGMSLQIRYDALRFEPQGWERLIDGSEAEAQAVVSDIRAAMAPGTGA